MEKVRGRANHEDILRRLRKLRPDTPRRWGRMTAPQMVCHLTDAFRNTLGERATGRPARPPTLVGRTFVKWMALYAPVHWPRGIRTRPEADQELGGTPPSGDFAADMTALEAATARFLAAAEQGLGKEHFIFGPLTAAEWTRWAIRHMDHHLRQFGL
jgi:Protein of unknown function (DUF1569)